MATIVPASNPIARFLEKLAPLLKKQRFKREPDERTFVIFGRKWDGCIQRIGILPKGGGGSNGDFAFSVVMGLEFSDLEPERTWIGMPRTHGAAELRLLNKSAKKEYVCTAETDCKELAARLDALIITAAEELQRRGEKLRKTWLSLVEARGSNLVKRLAFFGEQKAKELKARKPKGKAPAASAPTGPINAFEIAATLLRAKTDQLHELEILEFDDIEAHDRRLTQRRVQQLIDQATAIQTELARVLSAPHETGTTEHKQLPINGVCFFAYWNIGWKTLYLAVNHEDVGLPCCLLMGALARNRKVS